MSRRPRLVITACGVTFALTALVLVAGARPLRAEDPSRPAKVTVQPGDTLSDIAVRFYGSPAAMERIKAANKLADPNLIMAGTTLVLPPADGPLPAAGGPAAAGRQITVEPGDTLSALSQRLYGSPVYAAALAALNGVTDPNMVFAGMKLTVPAAPPAVTAGPGAAAAGPLAGRRICLDPGHGGAEEPGAVFDFGDGKVLREADVTLDVARTLRGWLLADGAAVTLTRTSDVYLGLDERAAVCNAAGADIVVSIHLNGGSNPAWNGALALFFKSIDQRLAERLAVALQAGLARNAPGLPFTAYGAQPFEGRVLLRTTMPAVIVEPVFLTNPAEARALLAPTVQGNSRRNQIVLETYRGIRMYFGQ